MTRTIDKNLPPLPADGPSPATVAAANITGGITEAVRSAGSGIKLGTAALIFLAGVLVINQVRGAVKA